MLGNFACFFCCLPIYFFPKLTFCKKIFWEYHQFQMVWIHFFHGRFVGFDLGLNSLQR